MEQNEVILVDLCDRETGRMEKMEAHRKGRLHRAFSVFLIDGERMLLQRRAEDKYHCGGLWTNACCSHPRPGESTEDAAVRRAREELGICPDRLNEEFAFTYYYRFANGITEYEYDHVFTASYGEGRRITLDPEEVSEIRWVGFDELLQDLQESPECYTPWFIICAPRLICRLRGQSRG